MLPRVAHVRLSCPILAVELTTRRWSRCLIRLLPYVDAVMSVVMGRMLITSKGCGLSTDPGIMRGGRDCFVGIGSDVVDRVTASCTQAAAMQVKCDTVHFVLVVPQNEQQHCTQSISSSSFWPIDATNLAALVAVVL